MLPTSTWNLPMLKKNLRRIILVAFCAFSLTAPLSGCTIFDAWLLPQPEMTAQDLFEAGNESMLNKRYAWSAHYFKQLKDNFPFSPYVLEAELSLADSYFLDEEWYMAIDAYKEFEAMHPRHSAIPYVLYQIGQSCINSYTSIDRPPTLIHEAMSYYQRLIDSFPGDEYAENAEDKIQECRRILAQYEIFMGDFYFRAERYRSAWMRYQNVLRDYSDILDLAEYATVQSQASYFKQVQEETEKGRRQREGSWRNWFDWL